MKIRDHADAEVARWAGYRFGALATILAYAVWRRPRVGVKRRVTLDMNNAREIPPV